ncbi:MAG: integrase core domain-containing protein [Actinomycetota bacterium]|nr:integrase core domain-containing protein [Actinomycetota bacterium]
MTFIDAHKQLFGVEPICRVLRAARRRRPVQPGEYTATAFRAACARLGVMQSMGRVACALDNAPAESFFSTLEHEVLSRQHFTSREQARRVVAGWIDGFYNRARRHSAIGMCSPIDYELTATGPVSRRHDQAPGSSAPDPAPVLGAVQVVPPQPCGWRPRGGVNGWAWAPVRDEG